MHATREKHPYPVVILCGGLGLRMREFTDGKPKALVQIGGRPVLWHVMKLYSHFGFRNFILPLGHGADQIITWFERYLSMTADFTLRLSDGAHTFHTLLPDDERDWRVTFLHAGASTETAGRLLRCAPFIEEDHFLTTYTDGLSDADLGAELEQHLSSKADVTLLSVKLMTSFGILESDGRMLLGFDEKPRTTCEVNGGFFVMRREVLDEIRGDDAILEKDLLPRLAKEGRMQVFAHDGFWHCMDTPKHVQELNRMWYGDAAPWKLWDG
ncbi:MAG: NTP transferase domain-containing protein [Bacteroidetes bacterium]|nr:NTP transferase domain-containing protein [Bacteroidota bacterium]